MCDAEFHILAYPYEISLSRFYSKDIWIIFLQHQRLYMTYHSFDAIFWFLMFQGNHSVWIGIGFWLSGGSTKNCNAKFIERIYWVRSTYGETTELHKKIFETFTGRKRLKRHQKVQPLYEIFDIFLRYTVLPDKLDVYPQRKSPSGWLPPGKRVHVQGA